MITLSSERVPIKLWFENINQIEKGALSQARNLANLSFAYSHVAIMPDSHEGYGMPIGGVLATQDVIVPNAVGVDIGCGMMAVKTSLKAENLSEVTVKKIIGEIRKVVPMGFDHHKQNQIWEGFDEYPDVPVVNREISNARKQLGTLGGGNHFIEIQRDDKTGDVWLMLHSGSRNIGLKIAEEYAGKAENYSYKMLGKEVPDKDLSVLPLDSKWGREYYEGMLFALSFAQANRDHMMARVKRIVADITNCSFVEEINIHHNYASLEEHFGKKVLVHRKGATSAYKDQLGIIPGSMGTKSYIVKGCGVEDSFKSCSHGAGRRMSRSAANKNLKLEEVNRAMGGVIFGHWRSKNGQFDFSEAPQAYKNIDEVIENEKDLIDIVVELKPIGVVKG